MKTIKNAQEAIVQFRNERDWKQFHTPDNLAKSIVLEATELLENYQWGNDHADLENVKQEVADVFGYLLLFCEVAEIDILDAFEKKMELNEKKYPVEKAYGSSKKYNKL